MKILSIGDLHGRDDWKTMGDINQLINGDDTKPQYDKYIFVGDYTDSFDKTNVEIMDNLKDIISFKKLYSDNVVLLIGNHDLQYWYSYNTHGCSGFRSAMYFDLNELFRDNRDLFQASFYLEYDNQKYLWTHAGIHRGWYEFEFPYKNVNIGEDLNLAFKMNESSLFDVGNRRGGFKNAGGPFWADKSETWAKPLMGYHQIVGHTRIDKIIYREINKNTSVTYIDCIENGNPSPHILELPEKE